MRCLPLHKDFAVEVLDQDLGTLVQSERYRDLRLLFETHSLLVFRNQTLSEAQHRVLAECFGPIEDLRDAAEGEAPERPIISNVATAGTLVQDATLQRLDIEANAYWHTDSSFLPMPSISNILVACALPSSGGETEFVSTRVGWSRLPQRLKARIEDKILLHRFANSRSLIDPVLGRLETYTRYPDTPWRTLWLNPVNGTPSLYMGAHAAAIVGMSDVAGQALIAEVSEAITRPEAIYSHRWRLGDVLIWDQRAILHRGRPWPYEEERTLASFVSSARESDGIASVRP